MINLINVQMSTTHWENAQSYGLTPAILRVCKEFAKEGIEVLYGLNTFFVDLQTMSDNSHSPRFPTTPKTKDEHELICLHCTNKLVAEQVVERFFGTNPACTPLLDRSALVWNDNIRWIRRLRISLRPYSYYELSGATSFHQLCTLAERVTALDILPIDHCKHSLQDALPANLKLDLWILHLSKPTLISPEEDRELEASGPHYEYPKNAVRWLSRIRGDFARDVAWLLRFAQFSAKTVVVPRHGEADPQDALQRLAALRTSRRCRLQSISSSIPDWALRMGQLSQLGKGCRGYRMIWDSMETSSSL
ncbi:hypothetical protein LTR56_027358 [Elasticomyces elasticus]|nr:hypothetical protein LTR22_027901 [Elasticomyces elasticus]KAK3614278.1 hypothetical protein LTR56_027358 [Elasticomyces elasticus]KAK4895982.1 hypothetical protein LTR49_028210 [Elasticomyces elasticus]KAK5729524.1 hypothetical protein LTS12_027334 [Elasticomyces elasticus]